jgi:hypothetical protein
MNDLKCARCGLFAPLTNGVCDWCLQGAPQDGAIVDPLGGALGGAMTDQRLVDPSWTWDRHPRVSAPASSDSLVAVAQREGVAWGVGLVMNGRQLGWMTVAEARELAGELLTTARLAEADHPALPPR